MGCSPSKGQLFSKKALPSGSPEGKKNAHLPCDENGSHLQIKEEISITSEELADIETQEHVIAVQGKRSSVDAACEETANIVEDASEKMLDEVHSQDGKEGHLENQNEAVEEIRAKDKQVKRRKQRKQRLRRSSYVQSKAEFVLKAHQGAYAYLNPSISKYESLLGLLNQAAQSHLSLQTTVASVVLHYEEINQALEEIAAEGEQMLREHGHNMMWPASLKDYPPTTKITNEQDFCQLPSEMLQQMLLQSTAKMITVGDSVKCLGDSALQDLAVYFGALSQHIGEKLLAKHEVEQRLKHILSNVEAAALRKPCLEDSALHSEDSGIGADNECQNGSERILRNRGSSGSGTSSGVTSVFTTSGSPEQQVLNGNEDGTDEDDDDDYDDDEDEASTKGELGRLTDKSRGSSETGFIHPAIQSCLTNQNQVRNSNLKRKPQRPKTADNSYQNRHLKGPKRSQSAECLCSQVADSEPPGNQKNQPANHWRRKNNMPDDLARGGHVLTKIRRSSSGGQSAARHYGLQYGSKGPFRAMPPSSPPKLTPEPRGRNAVRRLINTFSRGPEQKSRQSPIDQKPRGRSNKKCTLPLLQNSRGPLTTGGNISSSIHPPESRLVDRPEHLDLDSLPPPPPEMLMDNSFDSTLPTIEGAHDSRGRGQQIRISMQRDHMVPNRMNMHQDTLPLREDALLSTCIEQEYKQLIAADSQRDVARSQQFSKVPLPPVSSARTGLASIVLHTSMPHQGYKNDNEEETQMHSKCFPPTTPPVSRTRLPPSCPTVHHAVPSPPPTSYPSAGRWAPSTTSTTSSIHRRVKAEEVRHSVSGSQSYFEARAVFCRDNQSLSNSLTPSCTSTLPRPWGEPARGRLSTGRLQSTFKGHRPSHSEQPEQVSNHNQQQGHGSDVTPLATEGTNATSTRDSDDLNTQEIKD